MSDPPRNVAGMKMKLRKRHHECPDCAHEATGLAGDLDAHMAWIVAQVSAIGWAVPGVAIDGAAPPWAYSVGLWASYGTPDLAAFGRPLRQLGAIVNSLATRIADGASVSVGDEFDDACPSRLAVRDIHVSWRMIPMFGASDQFHGYVRPPMLQVVWADRGGAFPWEPRFEPGFAGAQPMLWLPVDDHPPGPWTRLSWLS